MALSNSLWSEELDSWLQLTLLEKALLFFESAASNDFLLLALDTERLEFLCGFSPWASLIRSPRLISLPANYGGEISEQLYYSSLSSDSA